MLKDKGRDRNRKRDRSIDRETKAETGAGDGANINLTLADRLEMRNESLISANALGAANGGNITIDTKFVIVWPPTGPEGSDIIANAFQGNGGLVNLTAQGIFGIKFRFRRTPQNDITATSDLGAAGTVQINRLAVDPSQGLNSLPTDLVDPTGQIDRRCQAGSSANESKFTVTGRGGLPPNPNEALGEENLLEDLGNPIEGRNDSAIEKPVIPAPSADAPLERIVEAQGWIIYPDGTAVLTADVPSATPQGSWQNSVDCRTVGN